MPNPSEAFILEPVPNTEAADWIKGKPIVSREVFDAMLPEVKARSFLITGIEDANVVSEIRELVAELPDGGDWDTQKAEITAKLSTWFTPEAADKRAETLLRVHGFQAYRTTYRQVMDRQADVFPYRQLLTADDERVRQSHRAWHEVIAPAASPFWNDKPGGFGCRCRVAPLLSDEVADIRQREQSLPLEDRTILDGARLKSAVNGRLVRALRDAKGKPEAPPLTEWNIANPEHVAAASDLRIPLSELAPRYDAETWAEFEQFAKKTTLSEKGKTLWAWLN